MPLLKNNAFHEDVWLKLEAETELPSSGNIIVSFDRLTKDWDVLARFPGLVGVSLPNSVASSEIAPYSAHLALVELAFPAFADGRSYSLARQLRLDGYRGEIRASGNILPDQIQYMVQVGIDSFVVDERFPLQSWQAAAKQMSLAYQRGLYRNVGETEVLTARHVEGNSPNNGEDRNRAS